MTSGVVARGLAGLPAKGARNHAIATEPTTPTAISAATPPSRLVLVTHASSKPRQTPMAAVTT